MATDTDADLVSPTVEQVVTQLTEWGRDYPTGRFLVIEIDHDDMWNSSAVGWGLAFSDYIIFELPEAKLVVALRDTDVLLTLLKSCGDVRLIWLDPAPERWPDDQDGGP